MRSEIAEYQSNIDETPIESGLYTTHKRMRSDMITRDKTINRSSSVSLMGQMQRIEIEKKVSESEEEQEQEKIIQYQDLLNSDHMDIQERILCTEIEEVEPTQMSQEGNSFTLFMDSKEYGVQCDILS